MIDRRNISNLYPLSPLQEGMFYHALRDPGSRAYFEQIDFALPGELDDAAYLRAWQDLVDRHDILRTVFAVRKLPQPLQIVLRASPLSVVHEDLRGLPAEEAEKRIASYRETDLAQGFDLTAAVPMRLALFTLADRRRVVWSFHHILLDGWSLAILQADLDALYAARRKGVRAALPSAAPFSAYIKWLGQRDRKEGLAFWQARLQGLELPTPVPRRLDARFLRTLPPYTVGEVRHALSAKAAEALPRLAASHGVTVSLVVQALWGMLLARMNGQRDAAFAATVSGRPEALEEAGRTVGIFINAVPVRVRLQDGEAFSALLRRLHAESIEAQTWHDCPLSDIQAAHPLRDALFDHILVFENYPQLDTPAQPHAPDAVSLHEYTHYNVEFQFLPGDPPVLRFRFHQGLYDESAIATIAAGFDALLCEAAAAPDRPARELADAQRKWKAPASLAIAASFTAEPVAQAVSWWLSQFACPTAVRLAPYNQCLQQLGAAQSVLNDADLGVLLFRFADAARDLGTMTVEEARSRLDAQYDMLLSLLQQHSGKPLLVGLLPAMPTGEPGEHLRALERKWCEAAQAVPGVTVLDLRDLAARHALDEVFDPASDRIGHLPYSAQACDAIAAEIARATVARSRPPFKVIAVDCDNTLWGGVVGEAGTLGVRVDAGHRDLQRFLLERQQEGFLIALASKNREEDVWAVFDRHPDMLLRREHIAASTINWQPKSGNLRQIAHELNLGVDSIVFIDDSPVECTEVMENCPEALAVPLPADAAAYGAWLARLWAFDLTAVTAEDRERTGMMLAESRRQTALGDADPRNFLLQLQLKVKCGAVQPHQIARVAQLTQRTNQFNLSGKRRDEAGIAALIAEEGVDLFAVEVEDRFGAYGLTGVVIARIADKSLQIDTLLLSCRVLGRKVEHALLAALARRARALGLSWIEAPLVVTDRNEPVRQFLACAPWQAANGTVFACAVADVPDAIDGIDLIDDHVFVAPVPQRTVEIAATGPHPAGGPVSARPAVFPAFPLPIRNEARLTHALQYLPLLAACAGWPRERLAAAAPALPRLGSGRRPAAGTEESVAAIWAEVLGREMDDADASFTELGGHSLHAVRAVSRLERRFNRDIGLAQFFRTPSIAALAAWLDAGSESSACVLPAIPRVADIDDAGDFPLSHNQQRLWILSRMGAAANVYNLCAAYRLRGALNLAALHRAVRHVVERHDALRTVIRPRGDEPRLIVLDMLKDSFTAYPAAAGACEDDIRSAIVEQGRKFVDLENGPLLRVDVHAIDHAEHVLAIHLHHLVGDGWSFGLLLDDLARAYARETDGDTPKETPLPLRYADYAAWTRSPQSEHALAKSRDYWLRALQPLAPIAQMPADFPRPATPGAEGASVTLSLARPLSALRRWCAEHHTTLFPLLAASVACLLHRCGGEPGVRLGMPVAGRDRPELERLIGFFANTTVLAAQLQPDMPFHALLAQMQERLAGALEHQSYPFDRLVSDLQPEREPGRNPLFDAMVVLQNGRSDGAHLPGLVVEDFPVDTGLAAFDLVFEFGEAGNDRLDCALRYRRDLYRADTAARLLERLASLLDAAVDAPATALQALPLIGARERALLDAFARGDRQDIPCLPLPALFERQAALTPDATAVRAGMERLDYRSLDRRANALAWSLRREHGVAHGEVIAVMLDRTIDWPVALLGVMKAGAVYLPLDVRHPAQRLRDLVRQSGARAVIASPAEPVSFGDVPLVAPLPVHAEEISAPPTGVDVATPAYLIFTSGSTGTPKGVLVQHRAFVNMILAQIRSFDITPDDVILHLASCAFDASLSEMFMAWLAGAQLAIADHASTRDGVLLGRLVQRAGASVATITPSHLRQLDDDDLRGLRKVILAAEAVVGRDARRLHALGIECFNAYGPTETAVCATLGRIDAAPDDAQPVPIGRPLANLTLRIVDDRDSDAPIGTPGELVVLGEGVALGYLGTEENAGSAFFTQTDGTRGYRTGDLCRWRPDGSIDYLGRKDTQVKIRGHRVEPGEIAAALARIDGVRQAEVVAEHGAAGTCLVAWLCGEPLPEATLRAHLAGQLPSHMMPARFRWIERMPLTTSGKLDRSALPRGAGPEPVATAASLNELERRLLEIWRELLPSQVDADTDFFVAGGNSLLAMGAARRIAQQLGHTCAALQFFQTPTVRTMAAALAMSRGDALVRALGNGSRPIFALPPHPGLDVGYASLARSLPEVTLHTAQYRNRPLRELLDDYAQACERIDGEGVLLGYSAGGKLALALANALERRGRPVRAVVLIDTWRWSDAAPEIRAQIDREMARAVEHADPDLAAAYRSCLADFEPDGAVNAPVHHLLASDTDRVPNVTRDWRLLARGGYHEHALNGRHHQLLDEVHAPQAAACLRAVLG
ncbi:MAG TPA: amino acid adenylation domain-containing protein [Noviherbaspirillum sp.]